MEHMIQPVVLPGALHSHHVLGVCHHADNAVIPLGAGAHGAGALPLREILAHGAAVDGRFGLGDGLSKGIRLLLRQGQHIKGQALGRFSADAGQLGKVLH